MEGVWFQAQPNAGSCSHPHVPSQQAGRSCVSARPLSAMRTLPPQAWGWVGLAPQVRVHMTGAPPPPASRGSFWGPALLRSPRATWMRTGGRLPSHPHLATTAATGGEAQASGLLPQPAHSPDPGPPDYLGGTACQTEASRHKSLDTRPGGLLREGHNLRCAEWSWRKHFLRPQSSKVTMGQWVPGAWGEDCTRRLPKLPWGFKLRLHMGWKQHDTRLSANTECGAGAGRWQIRQRGNAPRVQLASGHRPRPHPPTSDLGTSQLGLHFRQQTQTAQNVGTKI